MSDRISLNGLRVRGFHGVFDQERRDGQDFVVDVVLSLDLRPAGASDDLSQTVHYGTLADDLAAIIAGPPLDLIETLAERCAEHCLALERVEAVEVTVHKPSAPIAQQFGDVSVTVFRQRPVEAAPAQSAVLALGSNLGDREQILATAVSALAATPGVDVLAVSPVVETAPVGGPEQGDYLNAVVAVRTTLTPHQLLAQTQRIEAEHGRERGVRWGARTLDIDIVTVGDAVLLTEDLELPHPRAAQRAFVLVPWALMDPDAVIPGAGRVSVLATIAADGDGVRLRQDLHLPLPGQPGTL